MPIFSYGGNDSTGSQISYIVDAAEGTLNYSPLIHRMGQCIHAKSFGVLNLVYLGIYQQVKSWNENCTKQANESTRTKQHIILTRRMRLRSYEILFQLLKFGFLKVDGLHFSTIFVQAVVQVFSRECKKFNVFYLLLWMGFCQAVYTGWPFNRGSLHFRQNRPLQIRWRQSEVLFL